MTRPEARAFRRALLWGLLVAVIVAIVVTALLSGVWRGLGPGRSPEVLGQVPDFRLTGKDGAVVRRADLLGRPFIADFIFTRCAGSCPRMTAELARLDRQLGSRVRLVSVSVDPGFDTPEVLARYAAAHGASERWLFLTGEPEEVRRLVFEGFRLAFDPEPPPGAASPEEPILHSSRFVLVDGRGRIRGYYDPFDETSRARLAGDLARLGG